jgi:protease I
VQDLSGKKIAILAAHGFEQAELLEPQRQLKQAGASVDVVSVAGGSIRGWNRDHWDETVTVDRTIDQVTTGEYHALVLPGGPINPDVLRTHADAVEFVRGFAASGKPVGVICHGPWLLAEADVLRGRKVTSYHSIRTDMKNAVADWIDDEVVVDGNLITSRAPHDLPAFIATVADAVAVVKA